MIPFLHRIVPVVVAAILGGLWLTLLHRHDVKRHKKLDEDWRRAFEKMEESDRVITRLFMAHQAVVVAVRKWRDKGTLEADREVTKALQALDEIEAEERAKAMQSEKAS